MEEKGQIFKITRHYYKSYELPNNIVFSRDLKGNKNVFGFIIESAENIGLGIPLSLVWRSDSLTFETNLDEKFDGTKYTDAFGDVYEKDSYNRFNFLYVIDDVPPIVSTVYGNDKLGIVRTLTDGNIFRCFNTDGMLVLLIALNRHNLYIERNANHKITNVYDRYNSNTFNVYKFMFDRNLQLTAVNKTSPDNSDFKELASLTYSGVLVRNFANVQGILSLSYTDSKISSIESSLGYKITYSADKLEVKSTLTQVPDGASTSTAPAISSWSFNLSDGVNKITDVNGNREIYKFTKLDLKSYYEETAGVVTSAVKYDYDSNNNVNIVTKAAVLCLDQYDYEAFSFVDGEKRTTFYYADGTVSKVAISNVESDFVSSYEIRYKYKDYLVTSEETDVNYIDYGGILTSPIKYTYVKTYAYDSNNRLYKKTEYDESAKASMGINVEEYVYDDYGNLIKICAYNSLDKTLQFVKETAIDEYGRLSSVTDEMGNVTTYNYDGNTRKISHVKMPGTLNVKYGYDGADRLTEVYYDMLKNTVTYRDNEITQLSDTVTNTNKLKFVYDTERRVKDVFFDAGKLQSYSYAKSSTDKTVIKTNALNENFKIVEQKDGNRIKSYYNDNLEFEVKYNKKVDEETDYVNYDITTYDKITSETGYYLYHTYEKKNSNVIMKNSVSIYNEYFSYYDNGDLRSVLLMEPVNVSYNYKYNVNRQLESVTYGDVTVINSYDVLHRYAGKQVKNGNKLIQKEEIGYLTVGVGDGTYKKTTNLPSSAVYTSGFLNSPVQSYVYDYDANNRIQKITIDGKVISYEYDQYNRLVRENNQPLGKTYIYNYDAHGNITSKSAYSYTTGTPSGGTTVQYTYTGNKLTSYNGENCVYDAIGNPTTYSNKTATWKGRQMQSFNGITFKYDGRGRRIGKGGVTYYYDSQDRLIKTSDGLEFFYDMTGLSSFKYNASMYFYRKDIQGNIIAILDSLGKVVVQYSYDAWGKCSVTATSSYTTIAFLNPFRYRGYYYDSDTRLYYLKSRYYDPEVGRFLNMDAVDYADPETLGGLNLYSYCNNNPVMYIDPTGHFILQLVVSVISYVGVAIAAIFDSNIRNDMNAIGWNPFNSDETVVLNSDSVSFYKGAPVFRTSLGRSGTFCAIFLSNNANETALKHEYGHIVQQMIMGPITYGLMIGLPSWREWSNRSYYDRPWEITADIFGGVTRPHSQKDINRGKWYLAISNLFGPFGYFFLLDEY